jgi:hypothetical protein
MGKKSKAVVLRAIRIGRVRLIVDRKGHRLIPQTTEEAKKLPFVSSTRHWRSRDVVSVARKESNRFHLPKASGAYHIQLPGISREMCNSLLIQVLF